jgi:hypothetical protein
MSTISKETEKIIAAKNTKIGLENIIKNKIEIIIQKIQTKNKSLEWNLFCKEVINQSRKNETEFQIAIANHAISKLQKICCKNNKTEIDIAV